MTPQATSEGLARLQAWTQYRRDQELGIHQKDVVEASAAGDSGGISLDRVQAVENGRASAGMRPATRRALERGYQWRKGSVDLIFEGKDPIPLEDIQGQSEEISPETASDMLQSDYEDARSMLREASRILGPNFMNEVLKIRREGDVVPGRQA